MEGARLRYSKGNLNVLGSWMDFAVAYGQMSQAAAQVILHRSLQMSRGAMSAPEVIGMVMEKTTAFTAAAEKAAMAAASGANPARVASAALNPIHAKTRSNARKLRR